MPARGRYFSSQRLRRHPGGQGPLQPLASAPGCKSGAPNSARSGLLRAISPAPGIADSRNRADATNPRGSIAIWMEKKGWRSSGLFLWTGPTGLTTNTPAPGTCGTRSPGPCPEELHHTRWVAERSIANMQRAVDAQKPFLGPASSIPIRPRAAGTLGQYVQSGHPGCPSTHQASLITCRPILPAPSERRLRTTRRRAATAFTASTPICTAKRRCGAAWPATTG